MQKHRVLTRWIQKAFERHFIRTYSCCIQIVPAKVCLYDSTPGNLKMQLKVAVNLWRTLSNSSEKSSLKTNLIRLKLCYCSLPTHKMHFNNSMQHDWTNRCIKSSSQTLCAGTATWKSLQSETVPSWKQRALSADRLPPTISVNANDGSLDFRGRVWPQTCQPSGNTRGSQHNRGDKTPWD